MKVGEGGDKGRSFGIMMWWNGFVLDLKVYKNSVHSTLSPCRLWIALHGYDFNEIDETICWQISVHQQPLMIATTVDNNAASNTGSADTSLVSSMLSSLHG